MPDFLLFDETPVWRIKRCSRKIVKSIAAIKTENDRDECYWQIDRAFEEERISFEDHELLYGLAGMVEVA